MSATEPTQSSLSTSLSKAKELGEVWAVSHTPKGAWSVPLNLHQPISVVTPAAKLNAPEQFLSLSTSIRHIPPDKSSSVGVIAAQFVASQPEADKKEPIRFLWAA